MGKLDKGQADAMFDTPSDLLCPITHEILLEPVINGAGQVYEVCYPCMPPVVIFLYHSLTGAFVEFAFCSVDLRMVWQC